MRTRVPTLFTAARDRQAVGLSDNVVLYSPAGKDRAAHVQQAVDAF